LEAFANFFKAHSGVGQTRVLLPLTVADQLSNEITRIYTHSFFATTLLLERLSSCPIISVLPWPCVHPPRDGQSYEYREETHLCSTTPVTEYSTPDLSYQRFTFRPPLLSSPHHLCRFSSSPSHSHPSTAESGATGPYASICTPQTPGVVPNSVWQWPRFDVALRSDRPILFFTDPTPSPTSTTPIRQPPARYTDTAHMIYGVTSLSCHALPCPAILELAQLQLSHEFNVHAYGRPSTVLDSWCRYQL